MGWLGQNGLAELIELARAEWIGSGRMDWLEQFFSCRLDWVGQNGLAWAEWIGSGRMDWLGRNGLFRAG